MINEDALHARTQDAYSFDRYGAEAWMQAIRLLIELYTEEEVEWILRSKYMRWAADHFHKWVGWRVTVMRCLTVPRLSSIVTSGESRSRKTK